MLPELIDNNKILFFNNDTGEEIGFLQAVDVEIDTTPPSDEWLRAVSNPVITISLTDVFVHGVSLASIYGLEEEPAVKRLIYLHNKTKSKRIKKKLNMRILREVNRYLVEEVAEEVGLSWY